VSSRISRRHRRTGRAIVTPESPRPRLAASPRRLHQSARYAIEALERRVLLSAAVAWTGAAGDNQWTTPGNWSTNALPGSGDDVTINLNTNPTIQLSSGTPSVHSLTIAAGTTLATTGFASITITNGLTLNGTLDLGAPNGSSYGTLTFQGTQTLSGSGTVLLGASSQNTIGAQGTNNDLTPATLTIGSGITIHGGGGSISGYFPADSVVNDGTVDADAAGATIGISGGGGGGGGGTLSNAGMLQATTGTLDLGARAGLFSQISPWTNSGTIAVSGTGTLNLAGSFTTAAIGNLTNTGGTVNLVGVLNNAGATLALTPTTGSWNLAAGTIDGGTITDTPADVLVLTPLNGNGDLLSGVSIASGSILDGSRSNFDVIVTAGLTLDGTLDLGAANGSSYGTLIFRDTQTLGGIGTVLLGASFQNTLEAQGTNNDTVRATLTIGSGITIHGGSGQVTGYFSTDSVINDGTINVNTVGATITIAGAPNGTLTNNGTLEATAGTLDVGSQNYVQAPTNVWTNGVGGKLGVSGTGILNLGGSFTTADTAALTRSGGTLNIVGVLNNSGPTLALTPATGSWNLAGGTIAGGTISDTGGALLVIGPSLTGNLGTLSGVTIPLGSTLDASQYNAGLIVTGGLTLNGTLDLGAANGSTTGTFIFQGTQTLGGSGTVLLGASFGNTLRAQGTNNDTTPATLTIGSNVTIDGGSGQITGYFPTDSVINDGTINVNTVGAAITIAGAPNGTLTNNGTLEATAGTLDVGIQNYAQAPTNVWTNGVAGKLGVSGTGILNLSGSFTTADTAGLMRSGGTLNIVGVLNNSGTTLGFTPTTGSWNLAGGTIAGGTINDSGGASLVIGPSLTGNQGTLSGVTIPLGSTLDASTYNAGLIVTGGLTLNGTLDLGAANGSTTGTLYFEGTGTLGGTGTVLFGASSQNTVEAQGTNNDTLPATLTIGSGITINADAGGGEVYSYFPGDRLIFQGTIHSNNGGTLQFAGTQWTNEGTIQESGGGFLKLGGVNFTNRGTIIGSSAITYVDGILDNTGKTLALNSSTGTWYLLGGEIIGGTVTTTGTAKLIVTTQGDQGVGGTFMYGGVLDGVTLAGTLDLMQADKASGPLTIMDGLTLQNGLVEMTGDLSNFLFSGTQTLGGTGQVSLVGVATPQGSNGLFVPSNGSTLTIGPGVVVKGDSGVLGSATGGLLNNQGTIDAINAGTLTVEGETNFAGGTLTGGAWEADAGSALHVLGATVTTNAAALVLNGAGSEIFSDSGTTNALAGLATNAAGGSLTIQNGANLTTATLNDQGALTVGAGSTLNAPTLTVASGGSLNGSGTISGNVVNDGQLSPGSASVTGALTINDSYMQNSTGTLNIAIGGTTAGSQFDQLNVSGAASLGGTLNVSLVNGFGPTAEQTFEVMSFAGSSGSFATVNLPMLGGSPAFMVGATPSSLNLVALTSAPDLAAGTITFTPSQGTIGQNITINYTVNNLGTVPTTAGPWTDSVYLSAAATLTADAMLLGRVTHAGALAGLSSYAGALTAPLPGLLNGSYHVLVVVDSGLQVPDVNRANNTGFSAALLHMTTSVLSVGTPVSGTIAKGQDLYYRLNVTPGANVQLQATFVVADESGLFVRYGALPTPSSFDESSASATYLKPLLVLPSGQGGAYYILLHGRAGAGAGQSFQLLANAVPFALSGFDTPSGSNQGGTVTMKLTGSGFTSQTAVSLHNGGAVVTAKSITLINANKLTATFDLTGQPTGSYSVEAADGTQTSTAPTAFQVTSQPANQDLREFLVSPKGGLPHVPAYLAAGVINLGNTDVQIPVFELIGKNVNGVSQEVIGFGGGTLGPGQFVTPIEPNLDGPGYSGLVRFLPSPDQVGTVSTWTLQTAPASTTIDWSSLQSYRPANISIAAWDAIISNLSSNIGPTFSDLENTFQADSIYLAQLGESVTDQNTLLDFEFEKAADLAPNPILSSAIDGDSTEPGLSLDFQRSFVQSLAGRNAVGLLGYGWASNWDISAATDSSTGNVYIQQGQISRAFALQSDGSYRAQNGDTGILTLSKGSYTLTDANGTVTSFLSDGQLNYIQDSSGNHITAGYTGGSLSSLTHSNGDQMTLSYNAQGLVSQIDDPDGNVTNYTYDSHGQLIGVAGAPGNYQYTYVNGQGASEEHALASITNPDGTHKSFEYDPAGRLTRQSGDGGYSALTYSYLSPGGYTVTDANGAMTTILLDDNGAPASVKDSLGNVFRVTYNANGQPVLVSLPGGTASSITYNTNGAVASKVDPLGNTTQFTTDPQTGALQSLQDANGNTTSFSYTSRGLLSSILRADGSTSNYAYNAQGEIVQKCHGARQNRPARGASKPASALIRPIPHLSGSVQLTAELTTLGYYACAAISPSEDNAVTGSVSSGGELSFWPAVLRRPLGSCFAFASALPPWRRR